MLCLQMNVFKNSHTQHAYINSGYQFRLYFIKSLSELPDNEEPCSKKGLKCASQTSDTAYVLYSYNNKIYIFYTLVLCILS